MAGKGFLRMCASAAMGLTRRRPEKMVTVPAQDLIAVFEPTVVPEDSQNGKCALNKAIQAVREYIDFSAVKLTPGSMAYKYHSALGKIQKAIPSPVETESDLSLPVAALQTLADNADVITLVLKAVRKQPESAPAIGADDKAIAEFFTQQAQQANIGEVKSDLKDYQAKMTSFLTNLGIEKAQDVCFETELFGRADHPQTRDQDRHNDRP